MHNIQSILRIFIGITVLFSQSALTENTSPSINDKIKYLNIDILDLEVRYQTGDDIYDINTETMTVYNQLLYYERILDILGSNQFGYDDWNAAEQMLLNVKNKVKALQQKLKVEGDWGKVRLKLDPKESYQKIDLNYIYGF